jgi:predicted kinase
MVTLYLVTGPPASGKTTWVRDNAKHGDITIDYDLIAASLTPTGGDPYDQPGHIKAVTKAARQAAIDTATRYANTTHVYVIQSMPSARMLEQYKARGAHIITIDPGAEVVIARCKRERPWRMTQAAKQWYRTDDQPERQDDDKPTIELGQLSESW